MNRDSCASISVIPVGGFAVIILLFQYVYNQSLKISESNQDSNWVLENMHARILQKFGELCILFLIGAFRYRIRNSLTRQWLEINHLARPICSCASIISGSNPLNDINLGKGGGKSRS